MKGSIQNDNASSDEMTKLRDLLSQLSLVVKNQPPPIMDSSHTTTEKESTSSSSNQASLLLLHQTIQTFQKEHQDVNLTTIFDLVVPRTMMNIMMIDNKNDDDDDDDETSILQLSPSEAFQTMIGIVATNPLTYTLPALTSILNYLQNYKTAGSNHMNSNYDISSRNDPTGGNDVTRTTTTTRSTYAFLETIVQQIQNPSTEISHCASQILSILITKLPSSSSPHQRHILSTILLLLHSHVEQNVDQLRPKSHSTTSTSSNSSIVGDPSILFIRNLSLIIDLLIPTVNTDMYLSISILQKSLFLPTTISHPTTMLSNNTEEKEEESKSSSSLLSSSSSSSDKTILDPMISFFHQIKDPLLCMNVYEIIERVTSSKNLVLQSWMEEHMLQILLSHVGFHFVEGGSSSMKITLVQNGDIDLFNYIAAVTILSKFCSTAKTTATTTIATTRQQQKVILSTEMMIVIFQHIFQHCIAETRDDSEKIRYIGALTNFITDERHDDDNNERLKLLMKETNIMNFWFNLKQGNSDYKAAVLHSIAHVLYCKREGDGDRNGNDDGNGIGRRSRSLDNDMCTALHNTIGYWNGESIVMKIYMEQMKSSVDEIRLATYGVIKATIVNRKKNVGIAQIVGYDGFLTLLLTRNLEYIKEGKELKYDIVKGILESDMKGLLSLVPVKSLEKYVEQGPYYVDAVSGDMLIE